jgi:hypothetical protein
MNYPIKLRLTRFEAEVLKALLTKISLEPGMIEAPQVKRNALDRTCRKLWELTPPVAYVLDGAAPLDEH